MGEVLLMAGEVRAYTLSGRATHATCSARTGIEILLTGDRRVFNPDGVIAVDPRLHPQINSALAVFQAEARR